MDSVFYFPCTKSGKLLKGYCSTRGDFQSYLKDVLSWKKFGVRFVSLNGFVHSIV